MSPDLQVLKEKALMHKGWRDAMLVDPDTILALIEIAEAADRLERNVGALSIAETEVRQAISNTNWEVIQHWREKVRTALEGVKK